MDFKGFDYRFGNLSGIQDCFGEEIEECEVDDLSLFTNYTVQVAAYTSAGNGPWSPIIHVKTGFFGIYLLSFLLLLLNYSASIPVLHLMLM